MNSPKCLVVHVSRACYVLAVLLVGCDITIGPSLRGSGVAKTEMREVASFSEIEVGSAVQLDVTVGDSTSLVVTADDNILPLVRTEVVGDRLKIYVDGSNSTSICARVKATTPNLNTIVGTGAARITANGITADQFRLELHGASTCELSGDADVMDVTLSGASRGIRTGACKQLKVECFGASQMNAAGFTSQTAAVELGGASSAQVNAKDELTANASGASHLRYTGQPAQLKKQVSGASTVSAD